MRAGGGAPLSYVEQILDLAEEALDRGDAPAALELCDQVLELLPEHPGALFLTGESYRSVRDLPEAEARYRAVIAVAPEHSPSWSALATIHFDTLRFDDARSCASQAIRLDPINAEAYLVRAMLRERRGDLRGSDRDYRRAYRIDPAAYPLPPRLDEATVNAVVEEAIRALHPSIQSYLAQVAFILEEVPAAELCLQYVPPAPPGEILGYFTGVPLSERSIDNPWSNLPAAIVLFRRNLERMAWDRDRLLEELRVTVFHEVGHFLGLDEDDLEERGLD